MLSPCLFNLYAEHIMKITELDESQATETLCGRKRINTIFLKTALCFWNFPDSPVVKTLCFQSRGHGFDPWPVD